MAANETYDMFVEKFKPKKTTDDCYTPPNIYEAVKAWAIKDLHWEGRPVVRPFYPGGDYEHFEYPTNCVVIDNPPFSIISKIVKFYEVNRIDYFLFAPHLTCFNIKMAKSYLGVGVSIIYENGANVNTSFVASQGSTLRTVPELYEVLKNANNKNLATIKKQFPKYEYPAEIMTANRLSQMSHNGLNFECNNAFFIKQLDSQRQQKKNLFGGGFLIADTTWQARLEKARLEKARLENVTIWQLSENEKRIINKLKGENEQ